MANIDRICDDMEATIAKLHDQMRALRAAAAGENPVGKAIAAWKILWKRRHGADYELTKADAGNFKRLVTKHGLEELVERLKRYLVDGDAFLERQKHPLALFYSRINAYATPVDGLGALDEERRPVGCQHDPPCADDAAHTRRRREERRA